MEPRQRELRIKARFKGANGSVGYYTGREYNLVIVGNNIMSPQPCTYSSVAAFLHNWMPIEDNSPSFKTTNTGNPLAKADL